MLDVNRLRILRAVIASGSVHAAADNLGYTPSTVSQHLAVLQRETGLTLFEKAGRGIAPTSHGLRLADASSDVMAGIARLDGMVESLRSGHVDHVIISCFSSGAEAWLPTVVKDLTARFPGVVPELRLNEQSTEAGAGRPDLDVRTEEPYEPAPSVPGYERHVLGEEAYRVFVPADSALAGRACVAMPELADQPWIAHDANDKVCGAIIGHACRAAGFAPRNVAMSDDHHTGLAFVAAGIGIAVLPSIAVMHGPDGVRHAALTGPEPRRRIAAYVRESVAGAPAVQRLLTVLQREVDRTLSGA